MHLNIVGTGKRGHYERGLSLEESLESLNSLESLENGRLLLYFSQSGGSLKSPESLISLDALEMDFSETEPFLKDPFLRTRAKEQEVKQIKDDLNLSYEHALRQNTQEKVNQLKSDLSWAS